MKHSGATKISIQKVFVIRLIVGIICKCLVRSVYLITKKKSLAAALVQYRYINVQLIAPTHMATVQLDLVAGEEEKLSQ